MKTIIVRLSAISCVLLFAWLVAGFYDVQTGLTSLVSIGDKTEARATSTLRQVPHYTYPHSYGYDGAYYIQIALSPLLNDAELARAVDNLPYRARRILLSWSAWALGLGQPAAVVFVFPLLNVATWFALGWLLLRWFPLTSWDSLLRWSAFMLSHGICMSVRHSLVDAPSLLLLMLAVRAIERGRHVGGVVTLALAVLTKETSALGAVAFNGGDWRSPKTWLKTVTLLAVVCVPLAMWIAYIRFKLGPTPGIGLNNFTVPLAGLAEKWGETVGNLVNRRSALNWGTLACTFSLTVQICYLLLRWKPGQAWWRIGAAFATMALFLSTPVWEGTPGAATRVLLPMSLAFNILVPRGRRWLMLLVAGNLSFLASFEELRPPARFIHLSTSESRLVTDIEIEATGKWSLVEGHRRETWRWSAGDAGLLFRNTTSETVNATVEGRLSSLDPGRRITLKVGSNVLWSEEITEPRTPFRIVHALPPGDTQLDITTDLPPRPKDADNRELAFSVSDLKIALEPAPEKRP